MVNNEHLIADLKATKEALQTRGRCQISLVRGDGSVCLDGAVGVATIEGFEELDRDMSDTTKAYRALAESPRAMAVISALAERVQDVELTRGIWPTTNGDLAVDGKTIEQHLDAHRRKSPIDCDISAVWLFNDWTDATDQDCYDLIDKVLADVGGLTA